MTQRHPYPHTDLQGAATRNTTAAELLTAFAKSAPALDDLWRRIFDALADTPALITDIDRLRAELSTSRYQRANLIAAIRATLAAHDEGEHDPLFYVRDELHAQHSATARRTAGGGR
ncbi:hypothetical protein SAMN05444920_12472 [Nonomuraea solani]|uniref:Uncharacterized protein n=1 Tax=Nonomuraea solani TaxID=1144553 RepID=A0A1H6EWC7_9ACTN|nr:hypothetical protein [Nonomuraea solani]SEH02137.1 hypothetical protein SAMN05444920_12472 [Nonomuraea solani]